MVVFENQLQKFVIKTSNLPIKNLDDGLVISNADIAEMFKEHYSDTFQPHSDILSHTNTNTVEEYLKYLFRSGFCPAKHFSSNDIKFAINKYCHKKSPGFDLITVEVAKCLSKKAIVHLSHILNSFFPILWKFSTVVLVSKPKKSPNLISFFHLISFFLFFAKILEKLYSKKLLKSVNTIITENDK